MIVAVEGREADLLLSSQFACVHCGLGFDAPSPQLFSFNSLGRHVRGLRGARRRLRVGRGAARPRPLALGLEGGDRARWGRSRTIGKWRRHVFEGVAANVESDKGGPKKGSMLKGPWRDLDAKAAAGLALRHWASGTIVLRFRSQGAVAHARRALGRRRHRADGQVPRGRRRLAHAGACSSPT